MGLQYEQFGGETMASETIKLMNEIKKKEPLLQFMPSKTNRSKIYVHDTDPATLVYTYLDVVHPSEPNQKVGTIGYDGQQYIVSSRLIENGRYSHWSGNEHRSKRSKHMRNIVKEAIKSLLPIQFHEMWQESEGKFHRELGARTSHYRASVSNKLRIDPTAVFKEFLYMQERGYAPITQEFRDAIQYIADHKEEIGKYVDYKPTTYFVWVKPNEVQYSTNQKEEPKTIGSIDELPEEVRGKMFVLDVSDKDKFVEDVGMKADAKQYWVIV